SRCELTGPAASASVRASSTVGPPITSAARRAAISFCTASCVGTSTLPPMWPHFFTEASWSSQCPPAAPASIIVLIHCPGYLSWFGHYRREKVDVGLAFHGLDLVGAHQRVVDALHHGGHRGR